jgi:hypothetical protein
MRTIFKTVHLAIWIGEVKQNVVGTTWAPIQFANRI